MFVAVKREKNTLKIMGQFSCPGSSGIVHSDKNEQLEASSSFTISTEKTEIPYCLSNHAGIQYLLEFIYTFIYTIFLFKAHSATSVI